MVHRRATMPSAGTSIHKILILSISSVITNNHVATAFTINPYKIRPPLSTFSSPKHPHPTSSHPQKSYPSRIHNTLSPPAENSNKASILQKLASLFSQKAAVKATAPFNAVNNRRQSFVVQLVTFLRVGIPSLLVGVMAFASFPFLSVRLTTLMNESVVFQALSSDSSTFVQNFISVVGLLFSILVGQCYTFLYAQQESVYYAIYNEVTEAKSLLEQVALVCQGRSMYPQVLASINRYVQIDLKQLQTDPAVLLSRRPIDDPLESILYLTSVGVPSYVYETVRSLRQARAQRLGALQRKLPAVHMLLLWGLALMECVAFPLLGAGTQSAGGYKMMTVEGCLLGIMTCGIVMTLRVVGELWRPAWGASYNVDGA